MSEALAQPVPGQLLSSNVKRGVDKHVLCKSECILKYDFYFKYHHLLGPLYEQISPLEI